MELYLIRHGESYNNALTDIEQRVPDPPLTDLGHQQAQYVADYLANGVNRELIARTVSETSGVSGQTGFGITKLYCSAMYRALQTASPIGQALGLDPEVWIAVHEYGGIYRKNGDEIVGYPGKNRSEILAEFPNYTLPDEVTEDGWWKNGMEDWALCHGRAIHTADQLRQRAASNERIAIVSHGGFIDALLKAIFYQLPTRHLFYHHYNTAVTRLDFDSEQEAVNVFYINRINHLPPELVS